MTDAPSLDDSVKAGDSVKTQELHADVLKAFRDRFAFAQSHWKSWRTEARDLYDMVAGHQWSTDDAAKMKEEMRPMVTFNVAGKYIDAVCGLQINNRQDIRYFPRELGDAKANELLTGAVSWARDICDQPDEETDAFFDCIVTGMGWMECYLDKDLEPDGAPCGRRVDPMEMYADPTARMRNLADARWLIRIRYLDESEHRELFGTKATEVGDVPAFATLDLEDEEIEIIEQPQDYPQGGDDSKTSLKRKKLPVADYQWWVREKRCIISSPEHGERDMSAEDYEAYKPELDKLTAAAAKAGVPSPISGVKHCTRKVFYRALLDGSKVAQYGESPYQEGFTYHPITGKRDRNNRTWYGIGRAIIDPQRWTNKFFATILYTLMTNAKGGIMAEENAFKDARKAESEWAKPDSITWLKEGSLSGAKPKVEPKPIARYPEGLDRLMQFSMEALPQTSGLNLELMGLADRVQAGVVEAQRKQSAMAIIAWAFDAMRRYYRSMGRQQARYVIDYVPEGTLVRITGAEGKEYVPLMKSQLAFKYDVIVDEAPTSTNMKERVWAVLEGLIPALLKAGIKIPPEVLDYTPLPTDLAQKWKESMKPDPKEQALAQREREAEVAKLEGDAQQKHTAADKNTADAQKARSDAGSLPMDQNTQVQGEIAQTKIKADADMKIAHMKAQLDAQVAQMKAETEAQTKMMIAEMETRVMAQLTARQQDHDHQLTTRQQNTDAALASRQQNTDASLATRQQDLSTHTEGRRIESNEKIAKDKAKAKPKAK